MQKEKKIIFFIKKPADKDEVLSAVDFYEPEEIIIVLYKNFNRISKTDVQSWFQPDLPLTFLEIERENFTKKKLLDLLKTLEPYNIVGLPVCNLRAFYKAVPVLKKNNKTVINISDGVVETFTLLQLSIALKAKSIITFAKAFYTYFEYKKGIADVCFFQLYPLQNCLAKKTVAIKEKQKILLPNNLEKILKEKNVDTLLLPGWGETVETLNEFFPSLSSFCATTKELKFYINGDAIVINKMVTAEEVINTGIIRNVTGTASSAVYAAKIYDKNIDCKVLLNGFLNRQYGSLYEYFFREKGEKLGIEFRQK